MKQPEIEQVLLMAHGWGYNHRFFNAFLNELPEDTRETTLFACLEAGYFPDQAKAGLMIRAQGEWTPYPAEALHSLVLLHAEVPWLGLGHSLGFSKLLAFSVRWHSLFSVHGFTHFTRSDKHPEGTAPRVLSKMIQKAEKNMAEVLGDFHRRCGHFAEWTTLNEQTLLADLNSMQELDSTLGLQQALAKGTEFFAWASEIDQIVPFSLARACFEKPLATQGHTLCTLACEHAGFATAPSRYTDKLLPFLGQH